MSFEAIVEGDTHILVTPSFKGFSKHKKIINTNLNYIFNKFFNLLGLQILNFKLVYLFISFQIMKIQRGMCLIGTTNSKIKRMTISNVKKFMVHES